MIPERTNWTNPSNSRRIAEMPSIGLVLRTAVRIASHVVFFFVLFQTYKVVRRTFIERSETVGFANAERILAWERQLGIATEERVQQMLLSAPRVMTALSWVYVSFMPIFYACCAIAILFHYERFRYWRTVFLLSMLLALPWFVIFPLAPPRFLTHYGFVDSLHMLSASVTGRGGGMVQANQYAAMPSMHIGWTTIGAAMIASALPWRRTGRVIAIALVTLMTVTVVATANHYWLDVLGGWAIVAAAFALARWWHARHRGIVRPSAVRSVASTPG